MGAITQAVRGALAGSSGIATPEQWVVDWWKGGTSGHSGITVTADNALTYGPYFAGIRVLAEDLGSLPLHLYERLDDGRRRATDQRLYRLLHDAPNDLMGSMQLRETVQGHIPSWGDGFIEIVRGRDGRVRELWPLRPDRMTVEPIPAGRGRRVVRYRYDDTANGIHAAFQPHQVLHIAGLGFNGIRGHSIISLAAEAIGLGLAAERYGGAFYRNASRPSGILRHPKVLSPQAKKRMRADWEDMHRGLDRAQRIAILEEGVEFQAIGIPPNDAQFLETRKLQVTELARWLRLPPHKIGDLERATFSNIEHQGIDYVKSALRPWLVRWEQAIALRVLTGQERGRFYAEHMVDSLMRGDIASRYQAYAVGRQWGWLSADDVREKENDNPLPGDVGKTYLVPLNMVPAEPPPQAAAAGGTSAASHGLRSMEGRRRIGERFRRLIADVDERLAKMEQVEVRSLARRHLDRSATRSTVSFLDAVEDLYSRSIRERTIDRLRPVMETFAGEIAELEASDLGEDAAPDLSDWVASYVSAAAALRVASSVREIRSVVDQAAADDLLDAVEEHMSHSVDSRPAQTGRQHAVQMAAAAAREVWRSAGVRRMRWVAAGSETCEACQALDGVVVGVTEPFATAGEDVAQIPVNQPTHHPPLHQGCICQIVPA